MIRASIEYDKGICVPQDAEVMVEADGYLKAIVDEHNPIEITWSK